MRINTEMCDGNERRIFPKYPKFEQHTLWEMLADKLNDLQVIRSGIDRVVVEKAHVTHRANAAKFYMEWASYVIDDIDRLIGQNFDKFDRSPDVFARLISVYAKSKEKIGLRSKFLSSKYNIPTIHEYLDMLKPAIGARNAEEIDKSFA